MRTPRRKTKTAGPQTRVRVFGLSTKTTTQSAVATADTHRRTGLDYHDSPSCRFYQYHY